MSTRENGSELYDRLHPKPRPDAETEPTIETTHGRTELLRRGTRGDRQAMAAWLKWRDREHGDGGDAA